MNAEQLVKFEPSSFATFRTIPNVIMGASLPNYAKVGRFVMLFGTRAIPEKDWLVVEAPPDDESLDPIWRHLLAGTFSWKYSKRASKHAERAQEVIRNYQPPAGIDHALWARTSSRRGLQIHTIWSFHNLDWIFDPSQGHSVIKEVATPGAPCVTRMAGASRGCAFVSRLGVWNGNTFNDPEALARSPMTSLMWPKPQKYWIRPSQLMAYLQEV